MGFIHSVQLPGDSAIHLIEPQLFATTAATKDNDGQQYYTAVINNFFLTDNVMISLLICCDSSGQDKLYVKPNEDASVAAININYHGAQIQVGDLKKNHIYNFVYLSNNNSPAWELVGELDTNTTYSITTNSNVPGAIQVNNNSMRIPAVFTLKGTIATEPPNTSQNLPAIHKIGDTYQVTNEGTYEGWKCYAGTLLACVQEHNTERVSNEIYKDDWVILGNIISSNSSTDNSLARWDGNSGHIIQDSNITLTDDGAFNFPGNYTFGRFSAVDFGFKAGDNWVLKAPTDPQAAWQFFGNAQTATTANTATRWVSSLTIYVDLENSTIPTTIQGGETNAIGLRVNGTLPITNGGTGANSFQPNQVVLSSNPATTLTSRAYTDNLNATALSSTSENFVTERTIYYGLPKINNAHDYTFTNVYYAPNARGPSNAILTAASANDPTPQWTTAATLVNGVSVNSNEPAYTILTLGNNTNVSSATAHSEGQIELYSAATHAHILQGASTTVDYTHTLPNSNGILVQTALDGTVGSPTQPVYINNSVVTAITYTPNRLYCSGNETDQNKHTASSFIPTNHYANENQIALGTTTLPAANNQDTLYVNGTTYFNGNTTHNGIDYFANGTTYYINNYATGYLSDFCVDKTRLNDNYLSFYSGNNANGNQLGSIQGIINKMQFRIENGTEDVVPQFDFNGHLYPSKNHTVNDPGYDIGASSNKWNNIHAANGYYYTELWGDQIRFVDNSIGFYAASIDSTTRYAYVQGTQDILAIRNENGTSGMTPTLSYNGNISPSENNIGDLGTSDNRWAKLYIGTATNYGDAYTPIYWDDGVPTVVSPVQYCAFTINTGNTGVRLSHAAFNANSYVLQIVVTEGEQYLNAPIAWASADATDSNGNGTIQLTTSATSGQIVGYIIVCRGTTLTATPTQISEDASESNT